ncbi:DUF751 family protein [[Limnothrix rosea] IAM M-220]|uniref:DUF751 family protein n=1 Tax=[Limnothrix rosea] IAM M-220 TaxID=454133 RepID=UPI00095CE602|nr:DUF751 family protein [[Limnothrix rosea] IAM M-220]OKH15912.1 hypothetical protein NIES208_12490 [[Limnothrix rosea] IAM M-220]
MQEFFENVARYPRYMIALILGVFISVFDWLKPVFFKNKLTTTVSVGLLAGVLAFFYFTLRAMLGFSFV